MHIDDSNNDTVQLTGLTPAQRAIVLEVQAATGILPVMDSTTKEGCKTEPYGKSFIPFVENMHGARKQDPTMRHRRVIELFYRGSPMYPDGIPVGCTQRWRRKQTADMGPDSTFLYVAAKYDLLQDQLKRLKALANGQMWMSQVDRLRDEQRKAALRVKRDQQSLTPGDAIGEAVASKIADGIAEGVARAMEKVETRRGAKGKKSAAVAVAEMPDDAAEGEE